MNEPTTDQPPATDPKAARNAEIRRFLLILAICSAAITGGSAVWPGIDFSLGVALGCLIVGLNFIWTRSVVVKALQDGNFKSRVAISYLAKFALTVVVLYLAVSRFGIDPVAILVGVSSLLLAVVVLMAFRTAV